MAKTMPEDLMYLEWSSLPVEGGGKGVLGSFGAGGKDVVMAVVKQLQEPPSPLTTDTEVEWVLEVIRYGLSLPFTEHECIRECVRVCCAWLAELLPNSDTNVQPAPPPTPGPVKAAPHRFARLIFSHLHNLFIPRPGESATLTSKQAVLCHRVLRVLTSTCPQLGAREWRAALRLALAAAGSQLAAPTPPDGADNLCERAVAVLFELTILAAHKSFPSPPFWKTLREHCMKWRHRAALTEQWAKSSLALTSRLLYHMYGPLFPRAMDNDTDLVPPDMLPEAVAQTWCRILHTIGDPTDLCRPYIISQTPEFVQFAALSEDGLKEPHQHPCLQALPSIFLKAMKGVSAHVDAFLGLSRPESDESLSEVSLSGGGDNSSPVWHRPLAKSFSSNTNVKGKESKGAVRSSLLGINSRPLSAVATGNTPPNSISSQECETERLPLASLRPNVNSIFNLFGDWIFKASLIGTPEPQASAVQQRVEGTPPPPINDPSKILIANYQPGRAEALGALCRVLCSKKSREDVLTIYSARCFLAIQRGLRDPHTAAAVVLNAQDIFRIDLEGVLVLAPDFISALEKILPERDPRINCDGVDKGDLRAAAVSLLLSMVALPFHYRGLAIPELPGQNDYRGMTLGDLAGRVSVLCLGGVQTEWHPQRACRLLSALHIAVTHAVSYTNPGSGSVCGSMSTHGSLSSSGSGLLESSVPDSIIKDIDPNSSTFGSTLVVRSTYLVCHRLISSWKGDMRVSLAALELLSSLASLHTDTYEACRAVRWLCDYVALQTSRPPPEHSRELHSCIVSALGCVAAWLYHGNGGALNDRSALNAAMQVVELGLSGVVSEKPGTEPIVKEDKELKPVSLRVRDAAEHLLYLIMEQTDELSPIDEKWLSARGHGTLRHYIADDSIVLSILEEPLNNSQEPHPSLVLLIRGTFGRWAWSVDARGWASRAAVCPRPVPMCDIARTPMPACRALPTGPACPADAAFPSLDTVLRQLNDPEASTLFKLLEQQAIIEKDIREQEDKLPDELVPPEPVTEFQTARMFLANFGYLNITGDLKSGPRLALLDGRNEGLEDALRRLDSSGGARLGITAHVFCARAGQTRASDIIANTVARDTVTPHFMKLLAGLGNPVMVRTHSGWTGHVSTAYRAEPSETSEESEACQDHGGAAYDGIEQVLYWSDATTEIAFVVPSPKHETSNTISETDGNCLTTSAANHPSYDRSFSDSHSGSDSSTIRIPLSDKYRAVSLDSDKPQSNSGFSLSGSGRRNRHYTTKILIIWLEDYEDHLQLPIDDLLRYTETGESWRRSEVVIICCSALREGLIRVRVGDSPAWLAGPVIAPQLVRTAALQKAKQRSLLDDTFQPPHVRRRHLIQELAQQFKVNMSEPELLESLFMKP